MEWWDLASYDCFSILYQVLLLLLSIPLFMCVIESACHFIYLFFYLFVCLKEHHKIVRFLITFDIWSSQVKVVWHEASLRMLSWAWTVNTPSSEYCVWFPPPANCSQWRWTCLTQVSKIYRCTEPKNVLLGQYSFSHALHRYFKCSLWSLHVTVCIRFYILTAVPDCI